ncbi:Ubiquinone/menaquinone biosynthesis C-methylase UbiE [Amycolatopsis xylanica]|uniref:Ubiquinone/menaquinone biosynthesis C-methylase UbiE n=1 Tax=Amycolatopsis xylanica TaxID=589385 RepID=A0A1H3GQN3_9PSEU|nr:class I SAM-dependent methyltransferase [Amycolatopsis xylanica]SDY05632.1 Ubiquinone/menaquinone biosynthesis C-methylase UbiE [Amycolatopsis xylanica]
MAETPNVDASNSDQLAMWDGGSGTFWTARADRFNEGMAGYHGTLVKAAGFQPDSRVLDVGCGSGQLTRDAARAAYDGSAVGVDLSKAQLELARALAIGEQLPNATFLQVDAQVHDFGEARFDIAVSRHGTMFFGDRRAAFSNIARAIKPGGRFVQLTWQPVDRNEGLTTFRTIAAGGKAVPPPPAEAPTPFSLSDPDRVRALMSEAGFVDIELTGLTVPMYYGSDVDDAYDFIADGFSYEKLDDDVRDSAIDALRADIAAHLTEEGVFYNAAHWLIEARRSPVR